MAAFIPQLSPAVLSGAMADRPSASRQKVNTIYHATDTSPAQSFIVTRSGATKSWRSLVSGVTSSGLVQTVYSALAVDTSTGSNVFSTMFSTTITTSGGNLIVQFATSSSNNANNVHGNIFGVFVDGVKIQTAGFTSSGASHHDSVAINCKVTGVSAGLHTVAIMWKTDSGTLSCTPLTDENDSASILIQEVTV